MDKRRKCITCNEPLISFQGQFLHPDSVCAGLTDYIDIEATIEDDFLHGKFVALYGTPRFSDYERVGILEKHKRLLIAELKKRDMALNNPLIKFIRGFMKK